MRSVLGTRKVRVGPARARRRGRRTVEPGTHRYSEALPDRTNRFGAEAVGTDACDSPVLFLETEDDLQGLAPPACREQQCDWLALELDALDPHGVGPGLRRRPVEQSMPGGSIVARRCGIRTGCIIGACGGDPGLRLAASERVDPDVRRRAQQVGAWVANGRVGDAPLPERPQQRVLSQVVGVPDVAGEAATVAV